MDLASRIFRFTTAYTSIYDKPAAAAASQWTERFPKLSLSAAGLIALADLSTVARRSALTGTSALADALVLCPGMHKQQDATELNRGEYPACAAMTTGYVFRVENQATVLYLQNVGRPGQLTCLTVEDTTSRHSALSRFVSRIYDFSGTSIVSSCAYAAAVTLTSTVIALLILLKDWWGVTVLAIFVLVRSVNVVVMRRRSRMGWKGQPEPGKTSDLIVLASQDRWIRMRGPVDDVKAVTSGEWLREPTFLESALVATATLLLYLNAALVANATHEGQILLVILLFSSAGLLGLANEYMQVLKMYGRTIKVDGPRERFARRLVLTQKLTKETGRSDWAVRLGMAQPSDIASWEKGEEDHSSRQLRSSKCDGELPVML